MGKQLKVRGQDLGGGGKICMNPVIPIQRQRRKRRIKDEEGDMASAVLECDWRGSSL